MEVLNATISSVFPKNDRHTKADTFEKEWNNAISGNEFVQRAHEHIKKLYALRETQQAEH